MPSPLGPTEEPEAHALPLYRKVLPRGVSDEAVVLASEGSSSRVLDHSDCSILKVGFPAQGCEIPGGGSGGGGGT